MRKRINWLFVLLTIVAIIVTTLLATIVNYTVLKQEVIDDLRIYAQTLKKTVYADQKAENGQVKIATPLRITLVDTDGAVLYDSEPRGDQGSSQIWRGKYDTSFRDDRRQYDLLCGAFGQW